MAYYYFYFEVDLNHIFHYIDHYYSNYNYFEDFVLEEYNFYFLRGVLYATKCKPLSP